MKELLVEFLSLILNEERKFKAVKVSDGEERVSSFSTQANADAAVQSGTHRKYNPQKDKNLPGADGGQEKPVASKTSPAAAQQQKKPEKVSGVAKPTGKSVSAKEAVTTLYGSNGRGPLLLDSPAAQQILEKGFIAGKGAPPGSPGSNFNENISNEASLVLQKFPDMDEETLARTLFERVRKTALAQQQKKVAAKGSRTYPSDTRTKLPIPSDITDAQEKIIYQNCLIAARSGRKKLARALKAVEVAQKEIGFGKIKERKVFGGAKSDLEASKKVVSAAKRVFIYDEELGLVEIPKDTLIDWINASGGGKNASDTVQLTIDDNGNVIYDGWSDKKTLADIQGNSSLRDEYTKMADQVVNMEESNRISEKDAIEAKSLLLAAQQFSDELEDKYVDTSAQLADTFLAPSFMANSKPYIILAKNDKIVGKGRFSAFAEKIKKAQSKEGGTEVDKKLREFADMGRKKGYSGDKLTWFVINKMAQNRMLSGNERKILERVALAQVELQTQKNKGKLPARFEGLQIKATLRKLRSSAITFQQENIDKLNRIKVKNENGDTVKLGDHLKATEIVQLLHLDKIELPKTPGPNASQEEIDEYHEQVLVRSTQLVMEGIAVTPKTLRECLGVDTVRDFHKNFEVVTASTGAKPSEDGEDAEADGVEGSTVYIYAVGKKGERTLIARKSYRSKQGDTGKTGTTIQWEADMQNCFDENGAK